MKQILSIVLTLFTLFTITGQNVTYEKFAAYGTSSSVSLVSGSTYNITITGFTGNTRPYGNPNWAKGDVIVGDKLFLSCNQYNVASITGTVPNLVLTITKADATTSAPTNTQVVALVREYTDAKGLLTYALPQSGDGNGGSTQGISITLSACINAHYSEKNRLALSATIDKASDVYPYVGGVGVLPSVSPPTITQYLARNTANELYQWDGTTWVLVGSGASNTFSDSTKIGFVVTGNVVKGKVLVNSLDYADLKQSTKDSLSNLYSPTSFNRISDTIYAVGLTANESVINYNFASVDSLEYKFSTNALGSTSTEYGGWLANGTTGDSIAVSAPFWVIGGDSQAEGHPAQHGRLHVGGASTFIPNYANVAGTPAYHLSQLMKMHVFNHGIGGQNTSQVLARFDRDFIGLTSAVGDGRGSKTLERKPQGVIIIAGINDFYTGLTVQNCKDNLTAMAQKCAINGIYCVMLNVPGDEVITQKQAKQVDEINNWLKSGALNPYGVVVVDYNKWWRDPTDDNNANGNSLLVDDIHPSAIGYDSLATYIFNQAKLPILKRAIVYNNVSTIAPITGFSRPNSIRVDKNAVYSLTNAVDSFNITTPLTNDSVYLSILASTNISGTSTSGFSGIRWVVDNNSRSTIKQKFYAVPIALNEKWTEGGGFIYPNTVTNGVSIGSATRNSSENYLSIKTPLSNGNQIVSVRNGVNTELFSIIDNGRVNINGGGSSYKLNVQGDVGFNSSSSNYTFFNGSHSQIYGTPFIDYQSTAVNTAGAGFTEVQFKYDGASLNYVPHPTRGANYKVIYNKLGGANAVTLDAVNSRIGIGISTPDEGLHVIGNIKFGEVNGIYGNIGQSSANAYPEFNYNALFTGTLNSYTRSVADEAFRFKWQTSGFSIDAAETGSVGSAIAFSKKMEMVNGNVGIGTSSRPASRLTVQANTNPLQVIGFVNTNAPDSILGIRSGQNGVVESTKLSTAVQSTMFFGSASYDNFVAAGTRDSVTITISGLTTSTGMVTVNTASLGHEAGLIIEPPKVESGQVKVYLYNGTATSKSFSGTIKVVAIRL